MSETNISCYDFVHSRLFILNLSQTPLLSITLYIQQAPVIAHVIVNYRTEILWCLIITLLIAWCTWQNLLVNLCRHRHAHLWHLICSGCSVGNRKRDCTASGSCPCYPSPYRSVSILFQDISHRKGGSWIHLHIVVALKEIGDLPLAQFGVTELARRGRAAQNELSSLLRAWLRALVWID